MRDPYEVLGVAQDASEQHIKDAYRHLAVKYSTDDYATSGLQPIAQQKLAELDAAYDSIMAQRRLAKQPQTKSNRAQPAHETGANTYTPPAGDYAYIRQCINDDNTETAEQQLLAIDPARRGAEWNFLMGAVCQNKGWLDEACRYYSIAYELDPNNVEYATAYDRMGQARRNGSAYRPRAGQSSNSGADDCCNLLQCLCCMSMCDSCCCGRR